MIHDDYIVAPNSSRVHRHIRTELIIGSTGNSQWITVIKEHDTHTLSHWAMASLITYNARGGWAQRHWKSLGKITWELVVGGRRWWIFGIVDGLLSRLPAPQATVSRRVKWHQLHSITWIGSFSLSFFISKRTMLTGRNIATCRNASLSIR